MNFILIFLLFNASGYIMHSTEPGLILWESNNLPAWGNFNGTPDESSEFEAYCKGEIKYKYTYNENGNKKFLFDVHSYFRISKSWVKEYSPSQKLLLLEQLHFDIA